MSKDKNSLEAKYLDSIKSNTQGNKSLAERFKAKAVELAREGYFGSLKTRKQQLQNCYANLVNLIDQPEVPVLIYGETGSGKRRIIEEYLVLSNFYRRLDGSSKSTLRVLNAKFLRNGWTDLLSIASNKEGDFIYLENVDELTWDQQKELSAFLTHNYLSPELGCPRLFFGTEKALSMLIIQKQFSRSLFKQITQFAIFLPSLNERQEDIPHLIQTLAYEDSGYKQNPPVWFVNFASSQLWGRNIDELKLLLKNMLLKQKNMKYWKKSDIPRLYTTTTNSSFTPASPVDITKVQEYRVNLKKALVISHGDKRKAAGQLGMSKAEILRKMLEYRVR
ncbi:hypothetical protein GW915_05635 [bacterium]|nr:hypothetical protein [bacterium]